MSTFTDSAKKSMDKAIDALKYNFSRVRTGRANAHVLDGISVEYYGQPTPITQLAGVKVPEASMLVIEPWDKTALKAIEKAIEASDLGITPGNDGVSIRLPFPKPTEERRKELVEKDEELSEDDVNREKKQIQKVTDEFVAKVDSMLKEKTSEVMEI